MNDLPQGTLPRDAKGPVSPAPVMAGELGGIVAAVASGPGISATAHWSLYDKTLLDSAEFYFGDEELGHLHLDGSIHLASSQARGKNSLPTARQRPFVKGWAG